MVKKQQKSNSNTSTSTIEGGASSTTNSATARAGRKKKHPKGSFKKGQYNHNASYDDDDNYNDEMISMTGDDGNDLVDVLSDTFTMFSDDVSLLDDPFHELDDGQVEQEAEDYNRNGPPIQQQQQQLQNNHAKLIQSINMATSLSTEKRSSLREKGLKLLFRGITQYATGEMGQETIQSKLHSDILPICLVGLRGGGGSTPAEQYASCRILEATSILLGYDNHHQDDEYVQAIHGPLVRVVKVVHRAVQVRRAALRALAMACFIGSWSSTSEASGESIVLDELECVMDLCEEVGKEEFRGEKVDSRLRATAWECWALLGTLLGNVCLAGDDDGDEDEEGEVGKEDQEEEEEEGDKDKEDSFHSRRRMRRRRRGVMALPVLSECLDSTNDLELRCAVGGCLALIHEARLNLGMKMADGENASDRRYGKGSWDGSEWEVTMDETKQRVAELSVESGKHMSKKFKKDQRATFREFMSTIVDDESPCEVVTFRGGQLTLNTWREITQLNFIRHCLQTGFQIQLMTNETLQMVFGADASVLNTITQLSQLEKRHTQSKTSEASKQAYNERNKSRKSKMRAKYSFLEADGDGF